MRVRFAPSPTGQLHVGNARTALFNWLLAHGKDGTFILRIEDTDAERSTRESEAGILEDLRWLGLEWDEGPDVGGPHGPYRQSERLHLYASVRERAARGRATPTTASAPPAKLEADRQADLAAGRPPRYHGHLPLDAARRRAAPHRRGRAAGGPLPACPTSDEVRSRISCAARSSFNTDVIGDFVLVRSDGRPQYNFAVVIDDALMEITHVIRGEDHISNTPRQILLYQALGFAPPRVRAPVARDGAGPHAAVEAARRDVGGGVPRARLSAGGAGQLPRADRLVAARRRRQPGAEAELLPVDELARRFAIEDVGHSAGIFDVEKLAWMNRHYMKAAAPARLAAEALRYFTARGYRDAADRRGDRTT